MLADWKGAIGRTIRLSHAVSDVAWLAGDELAVSPRFGGRRAEVFSVRSGDLLRSVGPLPELARPAAGAVAARATLLRFDPARKQLIAFDAFYGELAVYSERGDVVRKATVIHPDRARLDSWIAEQDATAKTSRQSFMPVVFTYAKLTIGADGTIWLGEKADDKRGTVDVVRVSPDGKVQKSSVASPDCPSIRFEAWRGHFIFYRDPKSPLPACAGVRRQS
jgi:hypothetical protein